MKHLFAYSLLFICLNVFNNHSLQGMDRAVVTAKKPQVCAISILNTVKNTPINYSDERGNTLAHLLAPLAIEDRASLVKIFNEFIKKGIDPRIRNNEGKTAKEVALDKYAHHRHYCYASNANLFHRLEMGFSPHDKFVLEDDNMTISFTSGF